MTYNTTNFSVFYLLTLTLHGLLAFRVQSKPYGTVLKPLCRGITAGGSDPLERTRPSEYGLHVFCVEITPKYGDRARILS